MKTKTIIIISAVCLAFIGLFVWGYFEKGGTVSSVQGTFGSNISEGSLTAPETFFDFGTISMKAGEVRHAFKIKNSSNESVVINKMYTSCMCTIATLMMENKQFGPYGMPGHGFIPKINQAINPEEEATVEVIFDPAAHGPAGVGRIQRAITIENNAGKPVEFQFAAVVTP